MKNKKNFSFLLIIVLTLFLTTSIVTATTNTAMKVTFVPQSTNSNSDYNLSLLYENQYHNLTQVYNELKNFNTSAPNLIDYGSIGLSYYNNSIPLITLTNENIPSYTKGKTYIVAHHHAREQISIEHALRTIRDLVNDYGVDPDITNLLDHYIIYIIVTLNPDSLNHVLYENEYLRKTVRPIDDDGDGIFDEDGPDDVNNDGRISEYAITRGELDNWTYTFIYEGIDNDGDGKINEDWIGGVDLNRNYPFHWNDSNADSGSTSDKNSLTYPGEFPASEKETQALMSFVSKHNFTHAISLHSGTNATLFDWGYTDEISQPESSMYTSMDYEFKLRGLLPESFFSEENDVSYTVAGSWDDWTYAERHTIPLTLEIYHKKGSEFYFYKEYNGTHYIYEFNTMFDYFNPPEEKIDDLHSDLIEFEKYWLGLTPSIVKTSYSNITLDNGDKQIILGFKSSSRFFNTTDITRVIITPSHDNVIKTYTTTLPTLTPKTQEKLTITLTKNIPENFYFDLNVTSEWAADFYLRIRVNTTSFRSTNGFGLLLTASSLVAIFYLHRKSRR